MESKKTNKIGIIFFIILLGGLLFCLTNFGNSFIGNAAKKAQAIYSNTALLDDTSIDDIRQEQIVINKIERIDNLEETINNSTNEKNETGDNYYYSQLDSYSKEIYNELEKNLENLKTGTYTIEFGTRYNEILHKEDGNEILNRAFQTAVDAFSYDNEDLFYLDISKLSFTIIAETKGTVTKYSVKLGEKDNETYLIDGITSKKDVEAKNKELEDFKRLVTNYVTGTDAEKVEQVHDILINSFEYDSTVQRTNTRNIYGALIERVVVCEGYAKTFKYILDELGIPCILVSGLATNGEGKSENHMWNYVKIDGNWYGVDTTWDDPIIIGGGSLSKKQYHKYLLKGSETFNKEHLVIGEISEGGKTFKYPTLSVQDY